MADRHPTKLKQEQRPALAVLPIIKFPDATLRQRARKVRTIDRSLVRLAHNMIETMDHAEGVGLAANQVGVLKRVIVVRLPEDEEARVYVNPEIIHREGERLVEEGCLSLPGYVGTVRRSVWIKFRGLDLASRLIRLRAESLLAQVLEHEVDHLNGILYVDHLAAHETLRPIEPPGQAHGHAIPAADSTRSTGAMDPGGVQIPQGITREA